MDDKEFEKDMQYYDENRKKLIFGYPMDLPEMWVCQEPKTNKYSFGMELLLGFADTQASIKLVKDVLGAFTSWMVENGYDVNYRLDYWKVFRGGISLDRQYETIEEAYAAFRVLALGYIINARDTADAEAQNKTIADSIVFRYDTDIEKWRAYCEAPFEFELTDKNIVSLAEKVYMIIPAMEELVRACNRKADI